MLHRVGWHGNPCGPAAITGSARGKAVINKKYTCAFTGISGYIDVGKWKMPRGVLWPTRLSLQTELPFYLHTK